MRDSDGLTPDDERAIAEAAAWRRAHETGVAYRAGCKCEACMAVRAADAPRVLREDARERWSWFSRLIARVGRRMGR